MSRFVSTILSLTILTQLIDEMCWVLSFSKCLRNRESGEISQSITEIIQHFYSFLIRSEVKYFQQQQQQKRNKIKEKEAFNREK